MITNLVNWPQGTPDLLTPHIFVEVELKVALKLLDIPPQF